MIFLYVMLTATSDLHWGRLDDPVLATVKRYVKEHLTLYSVCVPSLSDYNAHLAGAGETPTGTSGASRLHLVNHRWSIVIIVWLQALRRLAGVIGRRWTRPHHCSPPYHRPRRRWLNDNALSVLISTNHAFCREDTTLCSDSRIPAAWRWAEHRGFFPQFSFRPELCR